ncbi:MAG: molybdenum cofactor biosynthesis protein MoaE [Elusimicrobiota bacterium]|nr:MAG: molybdenum cofactor biosynthesis protein MoaE [Elusimicrobiota bacterium]
MKRKVELYGRLKDAGLGPVLTLELPPNATARHALSALKSAFGPQSGLLASCVLAGADEVLAPGERLPAGRLAVLPGMRRLTTVTKSRLDPAALARAVSSPRHGAVASFAGAVRAVHAGRRVKAVSYDCFLPLAEKELARIAARAEKKWPARVAVSHRVGRLRVGELSVAIAAGSAHRAEAYDACRFVIEEIKRSLPVWKKEHYVRGDGRWLAGCALHRRKR